MIWREWWSLWGCARYCVWSVDDFAEFAAGDFVWLIVLTAKVFHGAGALLFEFLFVEFRVDQNVGK